MAFGLVALVFALFQYAMQAMIYSPDTGVWIWIRAASFTGATLIGLALFSSVIFRLLPRTAQHWRIRRYLGVWGVVFVYIHIVLVYQYYDFDIAQVYPTWNPFDNPKVFGLIASPIFLAMALTSSDWAMDTLTPRRWKFLHRFVYPAYLASVFHYISQNPEALISFPGRLLMLVTVLTIVGHLYLFFRTAARKRFQSIGTVVGLSIIAAGIIIGWMVWVKNLQPFVESLK